MFFDNIEKNQDRIAVIEDNQRQLTYRELVEAAEKISASMEEREVVFLLCRNTIEALTGYVGFLRKKVVPVLMDAEIDDMLFDNLLKTYCPKYVYKPQDIQKDFNVAENVWVGEDYELIVNADGVKSELHPELAVLLTTSGSTGSPKLVRQSYSNIEANAESISLYLELDYTERPITTLPMNYTYGLSIIHSHLYVGGTILMTRYPVNNKRFWDFFMAENATSFGGVPFTYEMLKRVRFTKMKLPSLRTMTQAGGKLPQTLHEEFGTYAQNNGKKFVVMYGQTEATARMAYLPPEKCLEKIGSMGIAIPNGTLELLDAEGNVITEPEVAGELVYRGKNVTLGYAQCKEDLCKEDEFKGVLHTGDVAKRDEDGYFYVVGRMKRFLKLFGSRVNLDEIDILIRQQFPNFECATTGGDDCMITFITDANKLEEVKRFILDTTHINAAAVKVLYCDEIPKNSAGKILFTELEKIWKE